MRSQTQLHGATEGAIFGGIVGGTFGLISYGVWRFWVWLKQAPATKPKQLDIEHPILPAPAKNPEQLDIDDPIRQVRLETEPGQSDATTLHLLPQPAKKPSFVLRHWRGELSLPVSYWIVVVLLGVIAILISNITGDALAGANMGPVAIGLTIVIYVTLPLAITAWQLVGTWRSAGKYMKSSKTPFWGGLARLVVIIAVIRAAVDCYTLAGPMVSHGVNIAFGKDDTPAYQLRLLRGGKELQLSGGMPFGTSDALKAVLDAAPQISFVHLNNGGGWITEGEKISQLIRNRKLATYTSTECSSACAIAFLGGTSRYLSSQAKLGFHSASFGSIDGKDEPDFNTDFPRILKAHGVPSWFISKVMRTSSASMWYPTRKELKSAGIITHSVDTTSTGAIKKSFDIAEVQRKAALQINKQGPVDYGNGITMVGVSAAGATLVYHYEVDASARNIPADWFPQQTNIVREGACKELASSMKFGARYKYHYTDPDGHLIGTIPVNVETCKPARKPQKDHARRAAPGLFDDLIPDEPATIGRDTQTVRNAIEDAAAHFKRGAAYYWKGDYDRAIVDYTQAIALNPKLGIAYSYRALAHKHNGDEGQAIADVRKALEINPSDEGAKYVLKSLGVTP